MDILFVRRRYFGSSWDFSLYHYYRDLYRFFRPTGYYFRFKGLGGYFRASLHHEANVTEKPIDYLKKYLESIGEMYDAIVVDSVREETDDFYQYEYDELEFIESVSTIPTILLVTTDRAGEVPANEVFNLFDIVYKREPYADRERYELSAENAEKIRSTMLACPFVKASRFNLTDLDSSDAGYESSADTYRHDVFFSVTIPPVSARK
ncbi:MAG: hypothetical protein ABEJ65_09095 [bacterium]